MVSVEQKKDLTPRLISGEGQLGLGPAPEQKGGGDGSRGRVHSNWSCPSHRWCNLECVTFLGSQQETMLPIEPEMKLFCPFKETRKD